MNTKISPARHVPVHAAELFIADEKKNENVRNLPIQYAHTVAERI